MSYIAAAAAIAAAAIAAGASIMKSRKEGEYQDKVLKQNKADARKEALERAINLGGVARQNKPVTPPNLFPYQTAGALANLGSTVAEEF